jgi:rare lipoprotein A
MKRYQVVYIALFISLLIGCSNSSRYKMANDQAPLRKPTTLETVDARPIHEAIYPWSIKPYTVRGKKYSPLKTAKDYNQQGKASWYGRKFHGHLTANGEVYDMFAMSAAHKTLPIPSYLRVTNLNNNKSIIVRVNDRGPFHDNRIIDLSYSAAHSLDIIKTGTANVKLESIVIEKNKLYQKPIQPITTGSMTTGSKSIAEVPKPTQDKPTNKQILVQVIASSNVEKINRTAKNLEALLGQPSQIQQFNGVYRLRLGPLVDKEQAANLIIALKNNGYPNAYMLYTSPTLTHN